MVIDRTGIFDCNVRLETLYMFCIAYGCVRKFGLYQGRQLQARNSNVPFRKPPGS